MEISTFLWLLVTILTICIISGLYVVLVSLYEYYIKGIRDKFQPTTFGSICFIFMLGFVLPIVNLLNFVDKVKEK